MLGVALRGTSIPSGGEYNRDKLWSDDTLGRYAQYAQTLPFSFYIESLRALTLSKSLLNRAAWLTVRLFYLSVTIHQSTIPTTI